jgi:nucleoid-associated protein YgaU
MAANSTSGNQGMTYAKILLYDSASGQDSDYLTCQFNPETITINKTISWGEEAQSALNAPDQHFNGGQAATYSLSLWFDTTSMGNKDVRGFTNKLLKLTLKAANGTRPPVVRLVWGVFKTFRAVVTSVNVTYKLFLPSGIPVRALAVVSLKQAADGDSGRLPAQNPSSRTDPRKTYRVQEGDRLDLLAYRQYGDATQWRRLAEANGIDNPLDLKPGQLLVIPQD